MTVRDWIARVLRTLLQIIAGGGLTALFDQLAKDVDPKWTPYVLAASVLLVTFAQNLAEAAGVIPTILKPSSPPAPKTAEIVQT